MRISIDAPFVRIARGLRASELTKTMHENLKTVWRISARAFFREVSQHVVIDTGMSMASMMPLASKVQMASEIERKLIGITEPKKGWVDISGNYHSEGLRSRSRGMLEAQSRLGDKHYIEFGSPSTPKLTFRFEIVIYQWKYWENAWNAIAQGRDAFLSTYEVELPKRIRVEDVVKYLLTGRVTFRGE